MAETRQRCLLVFAHPLQTSLSGHLSRFVQTRLETHGYEVKCLDLYAEDFDPRLSAAERASYHANAFRSEAPGAMAEDLRQAEILVLVFPTWWFGLPAILKGYVDRLFAPGIAFDHGADFGPIRPRLDNLRHVVAITTLGSPWWVDRFIMRRPVRRMMKYGIVGACAPKARFGYLSLYGAETATTAQIRRFEKRIDRYLAYIHR